MYQFNKRQGVHNKEESDQVHLKYQKKSDEYICFMNFKNFIVFIS